MVAINRFVGSRRLIWINFDSIWFGRMIAIQALDRDKIQNNSMEFASFWYTE